MSGSITFQYGPESLDSFIPQDYCSELGTLVSTSGDFILVSLSLEITILLKCMVPHRTSHLGIMYVFILLLSLLSSYEEHIEELRDLGGYLCCCQR